mmetsp:Transcript_38758/g.39449  ORF Transcript_38758/g.39449 Transcript_38758/m.39449 type:complete len:127 (+) Transcript_38758:635-1015(+)
MSVTKFNLAPRGFGRTSYRAVEIIQMGRIPLYLYNDVPWVPYVYSEIDYYTIGLVANKQNITNLLQQLVLIGNNISLFNNYLYKVRKARRFYTYIGVIRQIEDFLNDPFGVLGGYLKCAGLPPTTH